MNNAAKLMSNVTVIDFYITSFINYKYMPGCIDPSI